jgi:transposase
MEGCEDMQFKRRALIEFLTAEKILRIDIHHCMQAMYGDKCVAVSKVENLVQQFTQVVWEASLCEKPRSGRPLTATDESHQEHVEEMIPEKSSNQTESCCS